MGFAARGILHEAGFAALLRSAASLPFLDRNRSFMNTMIAGFFGGWEIVWILAVVLILFGAKKLPELAKGLGQGIKEFKKATREVTDEIQSATNLDDTYSTLPPKER